MLLSILVFFAVSGAVVGAYYALVHRPEHQVERQFERRLRELSTFDSDTPGALVLTVTFCRCWPIRVRT